MAGPFEMGRNGVVVDAPAQQVFEYLSDMTRHGEWNREPDFVVTASPQYPPGPGSVFRRERSGVMRGPLIIRGGMGDNPVRVVKTMTIAAYEPNSVLVFETRNSYNNLLVSIDKISFELREEMEGTRVYMLSEVEPMVPGAFMGPAYAIRLSRGFIGRILGGKAAGFSPSLAAGPHLTRIKEMVETGKITRQI
jgi:uncharacterized protein YndB with AHSA1/START domain